MRRGFVTVATGDERYYRLAANLLLSYKKRGKGEYLFVLICDRENLYSAMFDQVVVTKDIRKSTVDKLLIRYSPFDESIFIDADTLILWNIDDLWNIFENQDEVSAFGHALPLDSQEGWFTYEGSGKYKSQIKYLITMNGGIYYFRKSQKSDQVFSQALDLIKDYSFIDFKYFSQPQDEPLMAMAMVLNECYPCAEDYNMFILPVCEKPITVDYRGNVYEGKSRSKAKMIHFSTPRTALFLYNYLNAINHHEDSWRSRSNYRKMKLAYAFTDIKFNFYHVCGFLLRKVGMDDLAEKIKRIFK